MTQTCQRIVLASRPRGNVTPENFRLESVPVPTVGPGQVLVRNHYLSLDPYMRGRMDDSKSYAAPQADRRHDDRRHGGHRRGIANHPKFAPGDAVVGQFGWQEYGLSDGTMLNKVDTKHVPLSAFLGPVGMPGVTAWYGLREICKPKAGETVLVSAASGAVGSVVGQLAKMSGCRAVGIAGGPEKCAYVRGELGFDACLDHRELNDVRSMGAALKEAAPNGIDAVFENVGGVCLDAALARMNAFGRIALCGLIAGYEGGDISIHNTRALLVSRLTVRGFIVSEHLDLWPQALAELGQGVATGKIKYRESIADGLAAAPEAFIGMLRGRNFGKQLVKLI